MENIIIFPKIKFFLEVYMKTPLFLGCGTAIATPFNENGVNFDELKKLIEFQISEGIDALIVCGTTGESATMTNEEKKSVIKFAVETAKKQVPIIAGTGSNNTASSIEMSKYAQSVRSRWTFSCYSIL